jgi:hypothetical protein
VVKRLGLTAGLALGLSAAAATATPHAAGPPKIFLGYYHVSGYGVYHQSHEEIYTPVPCTPGSTKGGGWDGERKQVETIKWETVLPATAIVQKIISQVGLHFPPSIRYVPGKAVVGQLIVSTATVTKVSTGQVDDVSCLLDGTEDRLAVPFEKACGTHAYTREYGAGVVWPHVDEHPGENVAAGIEGLPSAQTKWKTDWKHCWGPGVNDFTDHLDFNTTVPSATVMGRLPFAHLPRKIRGKITAIARGHFSKSAHGKQGGADGGTFEMTDTYSATHYVTFVRTK